MSQTTAAPATSGAAEAPPSVAAAAATSGESPARTAPAAAASPQASAATGAAPCAPAAAAASPPAGAAAAAARHPRSPSPPAVDRPERASSFAADAWAGCAADDAGGGIDATRAGEAAKPYVAEKEPFASALGKEYEHGAAAFGRKIAALGKCYGALRRTRGDGNCWYRAVSFAHLEWLVQRCGRGGAAGGGAADVARFAAVARGWAGKLTAAGYQELVFEDALEALLGLLGLIDGSAAGGGGGGGFGGGGAEQRLTVEGLVSYFRDDVTSNTLVMLLRMVTSAELLTRREFFEPFVIGSADDDAAIAAAAAAGSGAGGSGGAVEAFCRRCVEPMGEESDHVQAVALTDAMQVPVRVVYLDSRGGGGGGGGGAGGGVGGGGGQGGDGSGGAAEAEEAVPTHDFVPEACGPDAKPVVHVLYRPGHYDVCYPLLLAPQR